MSFLASRQEPPYLACAYSIRANAPFLLSSSILWFLLFGGYFLVTISRSSSGLNYFGPKYLFQIHFSGTKDTLFFLQSRFSRSIVQGTGRQRTSIGFTNRTVSFFARRKRQRIAIAKVDRRLFDGPALRSRPGGRIDVVGAAVQVTVGGGGIAAHVPPRHVGRDAGRNPVSFAREDPTVLRRGGSARLGSMTRSVDGVLLAAAFSCQTTGRSVGRRGW